MNQTLSISAPHRRDYSRSRQFYNWQSEYDRLSDEEAVLRRKLYSMDGALRKLGKRLDEIQARMVELQRLMEQGA